MNIATKINKTKTDIESLEARLDTLKGKLKEEHPNHCTVCGGVGGDVSTSGDGWNEPMSEEWDDCEACLGQSLNPLDITKTISDEDAEAHIKMMMDVERVFPILSEIHEVELELRYAHEYLSLIHI